MNAFWERRPMSRRCPVMPRRGSFSLSRAMFRIWLDSMSTFELVFYYFHWFFFLYSFLGTDKFKLQSGTPLWRAAWWRMPSRRSTWVESCFSQKPAPDRCYAFTCQKVRARRPEAISVSLFSFLGWQSPCRLFALSWSLWLDSGSRNGSSHHGHSAAVICFLLCFSSHRFLGDLWIEPACGQGAYVQIAISFIDNWRCCDQSMHLTWLYADIHSFHIE